MADVQFGQVRNGLCKVLSKAMQMPIVSVDDYSSDRVMVGIPIPSLALQWLYNSTVIPLSRAIEFAGEEGSRKSTFAFEVMRWFLEAGGSVMMFETEGKDNANLRASILQYNKDYLENVVVARSLTCEDWVSGFRKGVAYLTNSMKENKYEFPVLVVVDSLMGAPTKNSFDESEALGHSKVSFAPGARVLTEESRNFGNVLYSGPVTLLWTNHLKKTMELYSKDTRPGGKGPKFLESYSIKFSKSASADIKEGSGYQRNYFDLKTLKNSYGRTGLSIRVSLYSRIEENPLASSDPEAPKYRERMYFDWGAADIMFLKTVIAGKEEFYSAEQRNAIASLIDLRDIARRNSPDSWAWSPVLGIPEDKPKTYSEIGTMVFADKELRRKLQDELCIPVYPEYSAGMSYIGLLSSYQSKVISSRDNIVKLAMDNGEPDSF